MYNLYPLLSGFVALPPLQLKATSTEPIDQIVLDELVSRYVPTHIYVLVWKISFWFVQLLTAILFRSLFFFLKPQAKEKKKTDIASGRSNFLRSE